MIEIAPLTEQNLADAPEWGAHPWSCKHCLYWEHPELPVKPTPGDMGENLARKRAWVRRVEGEFGPCGRILYAEGRAVGYAQYAPPALLPNVRSYPAGPASADAVFLACLFFPDPAHQGRGWGTLLLADILAELRGRGVPAVETFGRKGSAENPSGPAEFYLRRGFRILRDDPEFPLLRLDLR
ncbi:MAG: GNAT family N-acetyltransferase [Candidatus Bipolaricaulota bacterium]|nr:GNAT family N-acetyltransferase [Candidatus Bipolaricaulota bacterium]